MHRTFVLPRRAPWGVIACVLYLASLGLPAVCTTTGDVTRSVPGVVCLLLGWLQPVPWLANVVLVIATFQRGRRRHRAARMLSLIAIALASTTLLYSELGGIDVGFIAWIGSMIALAIASTQSLATERERIATATALRT